MNKKTKQEMVVGLKNIYRKKKKIENEIHYLNVAKIVVNFLCKKKKKL